MDGSPDGTTSANHQIKELVDYTDRNLRLAFSVKGNVQSTSLMLRSFSSQAEKYFKQSSDVYMQIFNILIEYFLKCCNQLCFATSRS